MLSEISRTQKDQYWVIRPIGGTWSSQTQRQDVERGLPKAEEGAGQSFSGCRVSVIQDKGAGDG